MNINTDYGVVTDGNLYWHIEPGTEAHKAAEQWFADRLKARKAVDKFLKELKRDFMRPFKQAGYKGIKASDKTDLGPLSFTCRIRNCDDNEGVEKVAEEAPEEWRRLFNYQVRCSVGWSRKVPRVLTLETKLWHNNKTGKARNKAFWNLYNAIPMQRSWFRDYISKKSYPAEVFRKEGGRSVIIGSSLFRPLENSPWLLTAGVSKNNLKWDPNEHCAGFRRLSMSELWALLEEHHETLG